MNEVKTMLRISPEGEAPFETTLDSFLRDNAGDEETCAQARALKPGERSMFGGGACPVVHVEVLP